MAELSDREYYEQRADMERAMARSSRDISVAIVHKQLAQRYSELARIAVNSREVAALFIEQGDAEEVLGVISRLPAATD